MEERKKRDLNEVESWKLGWNLNPGRIESWNFRNNQMG
jgi:hypothetical protein